MPATYEALSQGGHEALATEIFTKIKAYLDTHGADSKVSKSGDTMTGSLTSTKFIGPLQGTADKSWYLSPSTSRPTNANQQGDYDGGLKTFLATSSMSNNKPDADGHIIHLSWDNNGGWDSQIFISNGNSPHLQIRGQSGGTWGSWKTIYHDGVIDVGNQVSKTTFAYSKSGLAWGDFTWLAGWNGYELRAVNKNQITPAHIGAATASDMNTRIPSGYRIRAGTKVVSVSAATSSVLFTQAQVDSIVGVSGCTNGNTVVYAANGDFGAQGHYISACIYNPSNKTWCICSVMNGALAGGNFRANYIIIRFA